MTAHRASIKINATIEKVFAALTQPMLVKQWQFGRTLTTSWEPGSTIGFAIHSDGKSAEQWGTVLEFSENELISYNLFTPLPGVEDEPENYCTTSYILSEEDGLVKVELVHQDNRNGFAAASLLPILASLREVAEKV
jgi:uncharacterized protein YndB with AHSA1/START domain